MLVHEIYHSRHNVLDHTWYIHIGAIGLLRPGVLRPDPEYGQFRNCACISRNSGMGSRNWNQHPLAKWRVRPIALPCVRS